MRYELIQMGAQMDLVLDRTDGKRKWITQDEILSDIFTDPIFNDIN